MKQAIKRTLKLTPGLETYIKKYLIQRDFAVERKLIKGGTFQPKSDKTSILHFSLNKCATQYVSDILAKVSRENKMEHLRFAEYAFVSDFPYLDQITEKQVENYHNLFITKGCLYSVFGGMILNVPQLDKFKTILMIRDPRDILVSYYFSAAYSHAIPHQFSNKRSDLIERRKFALNSSIDEFVLEKAPDREEVFRRYSSQLLNKHNDVLVTKYEDMIGDFDGWLGQVLNYTELDISSGLKTDIVNNHYRKSNRTEDKTKHHRKGVAGDYKEKLSESTISKLNDIFSKTLQEFGYDS